MSGKKSCVNRHISRIRLRGQAFTIIFRSFDCRLTSLPRYPKAHQRLRIILLHSIEPSNHINTPLGSTVEESDATAASPVPPSPDSADTSFPPPQTQTPDTSDTYPNALSGMLRLAIPALGIVLSDPLQSLVDTAFMGHISSHHLASLGPNTAVFNFAFFLFAFLGVATSNGIASNLPTAPGISEEESRERRERCETTLCNALTLAVMFGVGMSWLIRAKGPAFLVTMGTAPELLSAACSYLAIRAFAEPAVFVISVLQGACLGQQDAWTPMFVCLGAGFLSFLGDVALVYYAGWGLEGAALATVAAQYTAALTFLLVSWRRGVQGHGIRISWKGWPVLASMKSFIRIAAAILARTCFGMSAFFAMTVAATRLGAAATAAHQIAMQTFWFLSFFPEPISLAAQTLIARDRHQPAAAKAWAWLMLHTATAAGVLLAGTVALMFAHGAQILTPDPAILTMVKALTPLGVLAMVICAPMMALDGISIGAGSFQHLAPSNAIGLAVTLYILEHGRVSGGGLAAVWWAQAAFYGIRVLGHGVFFVGRSKWRESVFVGGQVKGGGEDSIETVATGMAT